jgi:hypothetical protein
MTEGSNAKLKNGPKIVTSLAAVLAAGHCVGDQASEGRVRVRSSLV